MRVKRGNNKKNDTPAFGESKIPEMEIATDGK